MTSRIAAAAVAAGLMLAPYAAAPARADDAAQTDSQNGPQNAPRNAMGYRMLLPQDAAVLPQNHGSLGLEIERAQHVSDGGLDFDIMRVKQVHRGSAGAHAGFHAGDQIIAVDGQVFPTIRTFAAYIGSLTPGRQISVDTIPAGGGPQQAQRLAVTIGARQPANTGMSTGTKMAIGAGAVALFGCYELGCFSHRAAPTNGQANQMTPQMAPNGAQPTQ